MVKMREDPNTGKATLIQVENVARADHWYEQGEMRDMRDKLKGPPSTFQKLAQYGALAIVALGLMVLIYLFYSAFSGDTPPPTG